MYVLRHGVIMVELVPLTILAPLIFITQPTCQKE